MSKHTPGPWVVPQPMVRDAGLPYSPVFATTLIAKVYSTAFRDDEQAIANARLIAAAPDLLEALRELADGVADHAPPAFMEAFIRDAYRAIAKAEGKV